MNTPLGGKLIHRITTTAQAKKIRAANLPSVAIPDRKVTEVKNIGNGVYSPLTGFATRKELNSILKHLWLPSGIFWPIPIILDISEKTKKTLENHREALLVSKDRKPIALLTIKEIYLFPKKEFCAYVFRTTSDEHPGVRRTLDAENYLVGGDILLLDTKKEIFPRYNFTPKETRSIFKKKRWRNIVGFHTRNVPHRGHEHVQREGLKEADGIFVNPLVGEKKDGDFRNEVVLKAYEYFAARVLPPGKAVLGILPYSPYYAGPRETLLTAVIRKNFGCTHFIVGRDHAGVGNFYTPEDYVATIKKYEPEMGIKILYMSEALYCRKCGGMTFSAICPHGKEFWVRQSGTKVRKALVERITVPHEMMRPEIVNILLKEKELFV